MIRELITEKLIENEIWRAKNVWHWGKDKIEIRRMVRKREYSKLTGEKLLEKYDEMIQDAVVENWRDYV